jgi:hypothetical protein
MKTLRVVILLESIVYQGSQQAKNEFSHGEETLDGTTSRHQVESPKKENHVQESEEIHLWR